MTKIKKMFKEKNTMIIISLILIAVMISVTLISCSSEQNTGDKASTETATDENGNTIVVGTDENGEIVIYETDEKGNVKGSQKYEAKGEKSAAESKAGAAAKQTVKQTTQTTAQTTQAAKVCYISIDGYCSGKSITLQGGDTVYSILKRSGASVSGSSSYVKGINGLYEFDKGPQSGWKYSVNGSTPNVGCGSYKVNAGDNIRWYYVTSY